jgi:hypothetical protein
LSLPWVTLITNSLHALLGSASNSKMQILFIRLNVISPLSKDVDLAD